MRLSLLALLALFLNPMAHANDLSRGDAAATTRYLDDICGDTWCEGEFDWGFGPFSCDFSKSQCEIDLTLKDYKKDYRGLLLKELLTYPKIDVDEEHVTMTETCYLSGLSSVEQVKNTDSVYDQVSECITKMENDFYLKEKKADILSKIKTCALEDDIKDTKIYDVVRNFPIKDYYVQENAIKELTQFSQNKIGTELQLNSFFHLRYLFNKKDSPEQCMLYYYELVDKYYVETTVANEPNMGWPRNHHKFLIFTEKNYFSLSKTKAFIYLKVK